MNGYLFGICLLLVAVRAYIVPIDPSPSTPHVVDGGVALDPVHGCIAAGHVAQDSVSVVCPDGTGSYTIMDELKLNETAGDLGVLTEVAFGSALCIFDNLVVVGDPDATDSFSTTGGAWAFTRNGPPGSPWIMDYRLRFSLSLYTQNHAETGTSIACNDEWIVVGIPGNEVYGTNSGDVFLWAVGGSDQPNQSLIPAARGAGHRFGTTVAIHEDTIVVGSPGRSSNAGDVNVFKESGGVWTRVATSFLGPYNGGRYGTSVSVSDNMLAGGSPWASFTSTFVGAVDISRENVDGVTYSSSVAQLTLPQQNNGQYLGGAIGIASDRASSNEEFVAWGFDSTNPGRVHLWSDLGDGVFDNSDAYQGYWLSTDVGHPLSSSFGTRIHAVPNYGFVVAATDLSGVGLFRSVCGDGFWENSTSLECSRCSLGTTSTWPDISGLDEASVCDPCPAGTFATVAGVCGLCPQGTWSSTTGAGNDSVCIECAPGYTSPAGSMVDSACTPCPAGEYEVDGVCEECPLGTYTDSAGNDECSGCPSGTIGTTPGATDSNTCIQCLANEVPNSDQSTCEPCESSFSSPGDPTCTACAFPSVWTGSGCGFCPKHHYPFGPPTLDGCQLCDVYTWALPGDVECHPCPTGTVEGEYGGPYPGCNNCPNSDEYFNGEVGEGGSDPWELCTSCSGVLLSQVVTGDISTFGGEEVEVRRCLDCGEDDCVVQGESGHPDDAICCPTQSALLPIAVSAGVAGIVGAATFLTLRSRRRAEGVASDPSKTELAHSTKD